MRDRYDEDQPLHVKIRGLFSDTPICGNVMLQFVERIWPELESGYALLMREMRQYCTRHVNVPNTVTGRVKSRDSIEKSIKRREEDRITRGKGPYTKIDEILEDLHDLVGIRITVDFLSDTKLADAFVKKFFQPTKGPNVFDRDRPVGKQWNALFGAYESTNHHVIVRPEVPNISHKFDNVTFEIQVTCLAESLYNKLAHPLLYKENYGSISRKDEMVIDLSHGVALCFSICHLLMQDKLDDGAKSIDEPGLRDAMIRTAVDPESEPSREAMDALTKLTPEVVSQNVQGNKGSNLKRRRSFGQSIPIDSLLGVLSESPKEVDSNGDLWTGFIKKIEDWGLGFKEVNMAIQSQTETLRQFQLDEKDQQCLRDLLVINPEDHKALIERTKGGLLRDAYHWILHHEIYNKFRQDSKRRLLWIKGDPGKGKTMLLCGIIDELKKGSRELVTYFFCQATQEQSQRSAPAVLRSLIWLLCQQRPDLVHHIRESYSIQGKKLFEDLCALDALEKILRAMLGDSALGSAIFVIDALDECSDDDRCDIIRLIIELSKKFDAKWVVSSRNWPDIEDQFRSDCSDVEVSLELNKASVSKAVEYFIQKKVDDLERIKKYKPKMKQDILKTLQRKASDTFLWVALVCEELARPQTKLHHTMKKLESMPEGLGGLYERMVEQIFASDDGPILQQILATTCTAFRPMTIDELYTLVTELKDVGVEPENLEDVIKDCGSLLTTQERTVYFVHQTAQDFLSNSKRILSDGIPHQHWHMVERSLAAMGGLKRNIYDLENPGVFVEEITRPRSDPLAGLEYPCVFWVDHLEEFQDWPTRAEDKIEAFIRGQLLSWLEAASLMKKMPEVVRAVKKLVSIIGRNGSQSLNDRAEEMQRFVFYFQQVIKIAPLQVYESALVFSPTGSLVKQDYQGKETTRVEITSGLRTNWDATCAHILEGHTGAIISIAFSHDGCLIASTSRDATVRIWDTSSGQCIQKLDFDPQGGSVSFSCDGRLLAMASHHYGDPIKIWDLGANEFAPDIIINIHEKTEWVQFLAPRNELMVVLDEIVISNKGFGRSVEVWNVTKSSRVHKIRTICHGHFTVSIDGRQLASDIPDVWGARVWDLTTEDEDFCLTTEDVLQEFKGGYPLSFSAADPNVLALYSDEIEIRNTETGECMHTLPIKVGTKFSDGPFCLGPGFVASADRHAQTIEIWTLEGAGTQTLVGHSGMVRKLAYSPSRQLLASASDDRTIRLWDMSIDAPIAQEAEDRQAPVSLLKFSNKQRWLASAAKAKPAYDGSLFSVEIWDIATQTCIHTMPYNEYLGMLDRVHLFFSKDDQWFAYTAQKSLRIWDTTNWGLLLTKSREVLDFSFSPNCCNAALLQRVKDIWFLGEILVWDLPKMSFHVILLEEREPSCLAFSGNGEWIAVASLNKLSIYNLKSPATILSANIRGIKVLQAASSTDLRFYTNMGIVYRKGDHGLKINRSETWYSKSLITYKVSEDREWIVKGDERILWIPADYRLSIAVTESNLAMGSPSGGIVWGKLP
ncbi:unnamed protein product [Clonostachys rhizophaga]|uniref:NACHT domain-containing protein n=1 Tax=Clonostachys rhizophaga TaxID=160324 RepID=A0A9N9YWT8_9HYPO|nr:unnamed protein product [Clonostachys rhizophaga]